MTISAEALLQFDWRLVWQRREIGGRPRLRRGKKKKKLGPPLSLSSLPVALFYPKKGRVSFLPPTHPVFFLFSETKQKHSSALQAPRAERGVLRLLRREKETERPVYLDPDDSLDLFWQRRRRCRSTSSPRRDLLFALGGGGGGNRRGLPEQQQHFGVFLLGRRRGGAVFLCLK
jgi:hypothetical protein